ncbi:hypothetical protein [uncultured Gilvimarinus sp.]|uniref:hypothetical protein n=1 Tax=uncultured Gilvimarinus sp. TaxID=1689143 RepID=UPI0030DBFF4A
MLSLKKLQVQIDGDIYARGGELIIDSSATFDGYFIADVYLGGAGQGKGGDADGAYGQNYGQYGDHGNKVDATTRHLSGEITVNIGAASAHGESDYIVSGSDVYGEDADAGGDTTLASSGVSLLATGGGELGKGAVSAFVAGGDKSYDRNRRALSFGYNPLGGAYSQGGGWTGVFAPNANNGVVQLMGITS